MVVARVGADIETLDGRRWWLRTRRTEFVAPPIRDRRAVRRVRAAGFPALSSTLTHRTRPAVRNKRQQPLNTLSTKILKFLRSPPPLATYYSSKTHRSRSPTIADDVERDTSASDGPERSYGTRQWPSNPSLVLRWARSTKLLIVLGGRAALHAELDVFPSFLRALPQKSRPTNIDAEYDS